MRLRVHTREKWKRGPKTGLLFLRSNRTKPGGEGVGACLRKIGYNAYHKGMRGGLEG